MLRNWLSDQSRSSGHSQKFITRKRSHSAPCRQTLPLVPTLSSHQKSLSVGYIMSPHAHLRKIKQNAMTQIEVCVFKCSSCNQIRGNRFRANLPLPLPPGQTLCQLCELSQELFVLANANSQPSSTPYQPSARVRLPHFHRQGVTSYQSLPVGCRKPRVVHRHLKPSIVSPN
jgi:hypothetical protein